MKPLRVIGLGSPFGDDRAGWEAVAALEGKVDPARVHLIALDRPGAALLPLLEGAEEAFLVDAVRSGAPPGTLHQLEGQDILAAGGVCSSHALGLAETLSLGRALGMLPPLRLLGIEAASLEGEDLSPPVRAALPRLVDLLLRRLRPPEAPA